jgi:hypothetical protein
LIIKVADEEMFSGVVALNKAPEGVGGWNSLIGSTVAPIRINDSLAQFEAVRSAIMVQNIWLVPCWLEVGQNNDFAWMSNDLVWPSSQLSKSCIAALFSSSALVLLTHVWKYIAGP